KCDLSLNVVPYDHDNLAVQFQYNRNLLRPESVERTLGHFLRLLDILLENPRIDIGRIQILSEEEKRQILFDFNRTRQDYPVDGTVHRLFEEHAERTPDNIALWGEIAGAGLPGSFTYGALNEMSGLLSVFLRKKGLKEGAVAAVSAERNCETLIAILAILKTGAAYLPIDPDYPGNRIAYILKDSSASLWVATTPTASFPPEGRAAVAGTLSLLQPELQALMQGHGEAPVTIPQEPSGEYSPKEAYIIYTSGSTGRPKGVLIQHRSALNLVRYQSEFFNINKHDKILQFSSLCFDASVEQVWLAFASGAELVLVDMDTLLDNSAFERFLINRGITHLHAVPAFLNNLRLSDPAVYSHLKRVIAGGDVCPPALAGKWSSTCRFINEYGPTETTVTSIQYPVEGPIKTSDNFLPIGRPIGNTCALILDKYQKPVPIGVPGELYIGGRGSASGYLNNPELTAEKFIRLNAELINDSGKASIMTEPSRSPNDVSSTNQMTGTETSLFYKTGDRACWLPDGNIRFLGRFDFQVKIRGFRVETGEIENRLQQHRDIVEAAVTALQDLKDDTYLCAYIATSNEPSLPEIQQYLADHLPFYMIPSQFVLMEEIPKNTSGKIDRKSLPQPQFKAAGRCTVPTNPIESRLLDIWTDLLALEKNSIGINDNFFQVGGHSLKATLLVGRIRKQLNVEVPLVEVFRLSTIRQLGQYIQARSKQTYAPFNPAEKKEYYPVSPAQRRLLLLHHMDPGGIAYNIPTAVALEGNLDIARFHATMEKMVLRHESLRTYFFTLGETPCQAVASIEEIKKSMDSGLLGGNAVNAVSANSFDDYTADMERFVRPFDLSKAPLFRFELIRNGESAYTLLLDMHHIISDGTSMSVFVKEFSALYASEPLPSPGIQCKDYAVWLQRESELLRVGEQEQYWLNLFPGTVPVLELPYDFKRPDLQRFQGASLPFSLDTVSTNTLEEIAHSAGATPYILLLALFNILLSKLSACEDIIVGTPTAGRRYTELEETIGMFVNTLALRNRPNGEKTFRAFLEEVKERTLESFENQEYPFEVLVEKT
ncbi:MAG: amino acid adenylation domain-containing protein, partial [bacterium]|nr:amino acid adenylation domain-containing protein [bacterium]